MTSTAASLRESTPATCGGDLTDGVAGQVVGLDAPGLHQAVQRDLDGEQRGLRVLGTVQRLGVLAPEHLAQGAVQQRVQGGEGGVQRVGEDREGGVQFTARAQALGALAGEEERQFPLALGGAAHLVGGFAVLGQRGQSGERRVAVGGHEYGAVLEARAGGGQRVGNVQGVRGGLGLQRGHQ